MSAELGGAPRSSEHAMVGVKRAMALLWAAAGLGSLGLCALCSPAALAADSVTTTLTIDKPITEVRSALEDGATFAELSPDVYEAAAEPSGLCQRLHLESRGLTSPLRSIVLRCPTRDGWTERLESSDDFAAHEVDWTVVEVDGGTRITVRAHVEPDLPVPQTMIDSALRRSLVAQLQRFRSMLGD